MTDPRRILVLVYNDIRRDARVFRMSRALAERFRIRVVSIAPRSSGRAPSGGFDLVEVPLAHTRGMKRLKYVLFWVAAVWHGIRHGHDAVHCHDVYPLPAAALLARLRRVPLVYDAHELVDHREEAPTLFGRFWNWWHRWGVRHAETLIVPTEERARFLVENGYDPRRPPVPIMNLSDPPPTAESTVTRDRLGLAGTDHVVVYQGYIAQKRFSVELVEAYAHLPADHKLIMIGDGPGTATVRRRIRELGLEEQVLTTGYITKADMLEYLRLADAGVMMYDGRVLNNYYCAPNKLFDYAHLRVPIIGNDLPPIRRVLKDWKVGVVVSAHPSPEEIAGAVREIRDTSFEPERFDALTGAFSWQAEVEKLQSLFAKDVFGRAARPDPAVGEPAAG